ncbi:MAG: peptidoglycan-binding protein, partial [Vicinamibacterales bacterium]
MRRSALVICLALIGVLVPRAIVAIDVRISEAIWRSCAGDADLVALYAPGDAAPLWLDAKGALLLPGRDALRLLSSAADEGLESADYGVEALRALTQGAAAAPEFDTIARADVALSAAMLRYLRDLHMGRVEPSRVGFVLDVPRDGHDFPHLLREAIERRQVVDTARVWSPRGPQYPALRVALGRYRALAAQDAPVSLPFTKAVHPGDRYPSLPPLSARLRWLGDSDADVLEPGSEVYEGAVVEAVRRFQRRHGLAADGVLGKQTIAALQVPMMTRIRQLELAMERLRWLPHEAESRLVLVNIPMFRLFAWDTIPPAGAPSFSTGVIVGRATRTRTPGVAATRAEILYRP